MRTESRPICTYALVVCIRDIRDVAHDKNDAAGKKPASSADCTNKHNVVTLTLPKGPCRRLLVYIRGEDKNSSLLRRVEGADAPTVRSQGYLRRIESARCGGSPSDCRHMRSAPSHAKT